MFWVAVCLTVLAVAAAVVAVAGIVASLGPRSELPKRERSEGGKPLIGRFVRWDRLLLQPIYQRPGYSLRAAEGTRSTGMSPQRPHEVASSAELAFPRVESEQSDDASADIGCHNTADHRSMVDEPARPCVPERSNHDGRPTPSDVEYPGPDIDMESAAGIVSAEGEAGQVASHEDNPADSELPPLSPQEASLLESSADGVRCGQAHTLPAEMTGADAVLAANSKRVILVNYPEPDLNVSPASSKQVEETCSGAVPLDMPDSAAVVKEPTKVAELVNSANESVPVLGQDVGTSDIEGALRLFERMQEEETSLNQLAGILEDVDVLGLLELAKETSAKLRTVAHVNVDGQSPNDENKVNMPATLCLPV